MEQLSPIPLQAHVAAQGNEQIIMISAIPTATRRWQSDRTWELY